jgi:Fe-S cluster biogenesis protein NfuA
MEDAEARERVARVEGLLADLEALADPVARERSTDCVQALLELYGEGLRRIVASGGLAEDLAGDELVSHLLLLHGLHPVPIEERVRRAVAEVSRAQEAGVELLAVEDGVARVRLDAGCSGCGESAILHALESAVYEAAPDVAAIDAGPGRAEPGTAQANGVGLGPSRTGTPDATVIQLPVMGAAGS